jgi:xanthine dehydrogenase YagS FAD-binding subunit
MGQVAPIPWISTEAERVLIGRPVNEQAARRAGQAAVVGAMPLSENEYKIQLAEVAVRRAILRAAGLDTGGF